jgi:AraC family transcriptional regulator of adaptative response/methylated-DNA-[protein]-cysteine methyltransferase
MLREHIMYKALVAKDQAYEGIFFAAIKTTGIFCRPTCSARKPKRINVEFFTSCKDAILHGYRPCKLCSPLEQPGSMPSAIKKLIREIGQNPSKKIYDSDLRQKGVEPHTVRRWFKTHHGMTFQAYQRMMRLNTVFTKLHSGEKVTDVAFDSGYSSLSGFNEYFKTIVGDVPSKSTSKKIINITRIETPLGPMHACATEEGICLFDFADRRMLETEFKQITKSLNAVILPGEHPHFELLRRQIEEYFDGKRKSFTIPLHTPGTVFQKKVWSYLQKIPYGTTVSYKEEAVKICMPKAVRAVANANGQNRVSILIPCHRVIGSNGNLTGYGGGLHRKRWLLEHEKQLKIKNEK